MRLITLGILLAFPPLAGATILFSDFGPGETGPGGSFSSNGGYAVEGSGTGQLTEQASSFTPAINFTVTQIDIALELFGGSSSLTVDLDSTSGGFPGTVMGSWVVTSLGGVGVPFTPQRLTFSGIALTAGVEYWLVALPTVTNSNTEAAWSPSDQGGGLVTEAEFQTSAWNAALQNPEAAFDIVGTAITPEPGSCLLMGIGIAACAPFRKFQASYGRRSSSKRSARKTFKRD